MTTLPDPLCMGSLDAVHLDIWHRLEHGKADRHSPMHTPVVANMNVDGTPSQRVMVLRAVDCTKATLRFHTDIRSGKVAAINNSAPVSVLAYDMQAKVQLRLTGTGRVESDTPITDDAWSASSLSSRRCYLAYPGPGAKIAEPISGLPAHFESRVPNGDEARPGRVNFAVLTISLYRAEWLYLAAQGHRRAAFDRNRDGIWQGQWLIP